MDELRRRLLKAGLALPAGLYLPGAWSAAAAPPTPACDDDAPTPSQTAGPFYTPDSPAKANFRADDPAGGAVNLRVAVLDTRCRPVAGAVVDLWHADTGGRYDKEGFRLRGHQRAGADGAVRFETVRPGNYGGRTRHFHVRIFSSQGDRLLTTQLYFPDEPGNAKDWLFKRELLLEVAHVDRALDARFGVVVEGRTGG